MPPPRCVTRFEAASPLFMFPGKADARRGDTISCNTVAVLAPPAFPPRGADHTENESCIALYFSRSWLSA